MTFDRYNLAQILADKTLQKDFNHQKLAQEIAAYLLKNDLTDQLDSLIRDIKLIRQKKGIIDVRVLTSHQLSLDIKNKILSLVRDYYPHATSILIEPVIDPTLIGGVRLELANSGLDLSLKSQLDSLISITKQKRI